MRKNGVNKNLTQIAGGLCAPDGFLVGACACGIRADGEDLALLLADCRCSAAAVFGGGEYCGEPSMISKKHLRDGYARAIVVNGGVANLFLADGLQLADKICGLVEKRFIIRKEDILIASTGEIGKPLYLENFERGVQDLPVALHQEQAGMSAVRAITGADGIGGELSYSFDLGDFPCKIGVLYKANAHICPNMATTLVFLTTDVNITPEMLQKAFSTATRETLNGINIDGISSPNDAAYIFANGKAGNCKIDRVDTEYNKFVSALQMALTKVCKAIITGGNRKGFSCQIIGAKSKQVARELAKTLVGVGGLKKAFQNGRADVDGILFVLTQTGGVENVALIKIALKTPQARLLLFEDGKSLPQNPMLMEELLSSKEVTLEIDLSVGNFRSIAFGCID